MGNAFPKARENPCRQAVRQAASVAPGLADSKERTTHIKEERERKNILQIQAGSPLIFLKKSNLKEFSTCAIKENKRNQN